MHLLFDIGGTKVRIAAIKKGGDRFSVPRVIETPYLPEDVGDAIRKYGEEIAQGEPIEGVFGGIAGALDAHDNELVYSPNIPNWMGKPIKDIFEHRTRVPVTLMNDALLAAIGEANHGAGKGFSIVAYITVGTGVGGARVVEGQPEASHWGFEIGHQIVDLDGTVCPKCTERFPGRKGELETLVGGAALKAQTGSNPKELTDPSVWTDLAARLSAGVYNSILYWRPEVVVFGGSMILGDPAIPINAMEQRVKKWARPIPLFPKFKRAELGDFGVLHGAQAMLDKAA